MTGTPCESPDCDGWLVVYATQRKGGNVAVRYFHCFRCKRTASETETISQPKRRSRLPDLVKPQSPKNTNEGKVRT